MHRYLLPVAALILFAALIPAIPGDFTASSTAGLAQIYNPTLPVGGANTGNTGGATQADTSALYNTSNVNIIGPDGANTAPPQNNNFTNDTTSYEDAQQAVTNVGLPPGQGNLGVGNQFTGGATATEDIFYAVGTTRSGSTSSGTSGTSDVKVSPPPSIIPSARNDKTPEEQTATNTGGQSGTTTTGATGDTTTKTTEKQPVLTGGTTNKVPETSTTGTTGDTNQKKVIKSPIISEGANNDSIGDTETQVVEKNIQTNVQTGSSETFELYVNPETTAIVNVEDSNGDIKQVVSEKTISEASVKKTEEFSELIYVNLNVPIPGSVIERAAVGIALLSDLDQGDTVSASNLIASLEVGGVQPIDFSNVYSELEKEAARKNFITYIQNAVSDVLESIFGGVRGFFSGIRDRQVVSEGGDGINLTTDYKIDRPIKIDNENPIEIAGNLCPTTKRSRSANGVVSFTVSGNETIEISTSATCMNEDDEMRILCDATEQNSGSDKGGTLSFAERPKSIVTICKASCIPETGGDPYDPTPEGGSGNKPIGEELFEAVQAKQAEIVKTATEQCYEKLSEEVDVECQRSCPNNVANPPCDCVLSDVNVDFACDTSALEDSFSEALKTTASNTPFSRGGSSKDLRATISGITYSGKVKGSWESKITEACGNEAGRTEIKLPTVPSEEDGSDEGDSASGGGGGGGATPAGILDFPAILGDFVQTWLSAVFGVSGGSGGGSDTPDGLNFSVMEVPICKYQTTVMVYVPADGSCSKCNQFWSDLTRLLKQTDALYHDIRKIPVTVTERNAAGSAVGWNNAEYEQAVRDRLCGGYPCTIVKRTPTSDSDANCPSGKSVVSGGILSVAELVANRVKALEGELPDTEKRLINPSISSNASIPDSESDGVENAADDEVYYYSTSGSDGVMYSGCRGGNCKPRSNPYTQPWVNNSPTVTKYPTSKDPQVCSGSYPVCGGGCPTGSTCKTIGASRFEPSGCGCFNQNNVRVRENETVSSQPTSEDIYCDAPKDQGETNVLVSEVANDYISFYSKENNKLPDTTEVVAYLNRNISDLGIDCSGNSCPTSGACKAGVDIYANTNTGDIRADAVCRCAGVSGEAVQLKPINSNTPPVAASGSPDGEDCPDGKCPKGQPAFPAGTEPPSTQLRSPTQSKPPTTRTSEGENMGVKPSEVTSSEDLPFAPAYPAGGARTKTPSNNPPAGTGPAATGSPDGDSVTSPAPASPVTQPAKAPGFGRNPGFGSTVVNECPAPTYVNEAVVGVVLNDLDEWQTLAAKKEDKEKNPDDARIVFGENELFRMAELEAKIAQAVSCGDNLCGATRKNCSLFIQAGVYPRITGNASSLANIKCSCTDGFATNPAGKSDPGKTVPASPLMPRVIVKSGGQCGAPTYQPKESSGYKDSEDFIVQKLDEVERLVSDKEKEIKKTESDYGRIRDFHYRDTKDEYRSYQKEGENRAEFQRRMNEERDAKLAQLKKEKDALTTDKLNEKIAEAYTCPTPGNICGSGRGCEPRATLVGGARDIGDKAVVVNCGCPAVASLPPIIGEAEEPSSSVNGGISIEDIAQLDKLGLNQPEEEVEGVDKCSAVRNFTLESALEDISHKYDVYLEAQKAVENTPGGKLTETGSSMKVRNETIAKDALDDYVNTTKFVKGSLDAGAYGPVCESDDKVCGAGKCVESGLTRVDGKFTVACSCEGGATGPNPSAAVSKVGQIPKTSPTSPWSAGNPNPDNSTVPAPESINTAIKGCRAKEIVKGSAEYAALRKIAAEHYDAIIDYKNKEIGYFKLMELWDKEYAEAETVIECLSEEDTCSNGESCKPRVSFVEYSDSNPAVKIAPVRYGCGCTNKDSYGINSLDVQDDNKIYFDLNKTEDWGNQASPAAPAPDDASSNTPIEPSPSGTSPVVGASKSDKESNPSANPVPAEKKITEKSTCADYTLDKINETVQYFKDKYKGEIENNKMKIKKDGIIYVDGESCLTTVLDSTTGVMIDSDDRIVFYRLRGWHSPECSTARTSQFNISTDEDPALGVKKETCFYLTNTCTKDQCDYIETTKGCQCGGETQAPQTEAVQDSPEEVSDVSAAPGGEEPPPASTMSPAISDPEGDSACFVNSEDLPLLGENEKGESTYDGKVWGKSNTAGEITVLNSTICIKYKQAYSDACASKSCSVGGVEKSCGVSANSGECGLCGGSLPTLRNIEKICEVQIAPTPQTSPISRRTGTDPTPTKQPASPKPQSTPKKQPITPTPNTTSSDDTKCTIKVYGGPGCSNCTATYAALSQAGVPSSKLQYEHTNKQLFYSENPGLSGCGILPHVVVICPSGRKGAFCPTNAQTNVINQILKSAGY